MKKQLKQFVTLLPRKYIQIKTQMLLKDFKNIRKNYKIIPFGNYCLPRVICTISGLKQSKQEGEESFPFDLCFSVFEENLKLLSSKFEFFYNNIEYNTNEKVSNCWENKSLQMLFNHDFMPSLNEFKERYDNRIKNLYAILKDENKHLYFLVATWSYIKKEKIESFINEILKYRPRKSFSLIIINQSTTKTEYFSEDIYCINLNKDKTFVKINKESDWVGELKKMKDINAIRFNYKVIKKLSKILKSHL